MAIVRTKQHVEEVLKDILGDEASTSLTAPLEQLYFESQAPLNIYVVHVGGSGGDLRPFFNLISKLVTDIPARYYLFLGDVHRRSTFNIPIGLNLGKAVTLFDDVKSFLIALTRASNVDVIIGNQLGKWRTAGAGLRTQKWMELLTRALTERQGLLIE